MGLLTALGLKPSPAMLAKAGKALAGQDPADESLKKKAADELHRRLGNLKSNIDKAVQLAGAGAQAVKKRLADAEQLMEEAVKSGVKEAVDKAHRAIDVVQMAVDDALADGDTKARQHEQAQQEHKEVERLRDQAAEQADKIHDPGARTKLKTVLQALDAELKKLQKQADEKQRLQALKLLRDKAEQAAKLAAQLASQDGKSHAKPDPMKSPEMKALVARFQQVMGQIKTLEGAKAPEAPALKKAAIAAGNLSTSPKGIVQANLALDQVEAQIEDAKLKLADAQGAREVAAQAAGPDVGKLVAQARQRLKSLEQRGRKALKADPNNPNDGWLTDGVARSEQDIAELQKLGTKREIGIVDDGLAFLEDAIVGWETGKRPSEQQVPDLAKRVDDARKRLKSQEQRGRKALEADPRNPNAGWLTEVVANTEERIVALEKRGTRREADDVNKQLDWLEDNILRFEADAKKSADQAKDGGKDVDAQAQAKPPAEDSPELKKVKAHFRRVMTEVKKLADAKVPEAEALRKAAVDAGNLATSPKGIQKAEKALDAVMADITKARAAADKARADAAQAKADADKAAAETFDLTVGGRKLQGVHRAEALQALQAEANRLNAQLEGGWAYHVDQMNLPAQVPFQAWLTTGVDAVKSFFKGQDAAKMPDLNIWDAAREMMIELHKAEKKGDVKAIEALLPKIDKSIQQARAKVGKYDQQMQDSAQTGVDAGRFVEDTAASAEGTIVGTVVEARTKNKAAGKAAKVATQATAAALFQGVEQVTEWVLGMRQAPDWGAIGKKAGEEAAGAIVKELIAGALAEPFKSAFGSYLGKGVDAKLLAELGIGRDAYMTAGQKFFAEFCAKQSAGLIKSAVFKLLQGKVPDSPAALADATVAELMKGSAKHMVTEGIKELTKSLVK